MLKIFYIFQCEIEKYTVIYQNNIVSDIDLNKRKRLPLVKTDLTMLELKDISSIKFHQNLNLDNVDEFYGCLYVNEGSTLGGSMIQAAMLKSFGAEATAWTNYLNPYRDEVMPMWLAFKTALNNEIISNQVNLDDVVNGALKTFEFLICLTQEKSNI